VLGSVQKFTSKVCKSATTEGGKSSIEALCALWIPEWLGGHAS